MQPENVNNKKGAVAWMAGNSVAANIFIAFLIIGGLLIGPKIKQEVFPEFDMGMVNISVNYPGASPEEVESGIIFSIEEAVQNIDGIGEVSSVASEGSGKVTVEIMEGSDITKISREIESEVNSISSFPVDAETPMVSIASRRREVISYALYGDQSEIVLSQQAEALRDALLSDPEITQVTIEGIRDYEIQIEISTENLRRYNISIQDIATRLQKMAADIPGGSLETSRGEILVRMKERKERASEFGEIPVITNPDGSRILLRDIATISDGFSDSHRYEYFNGQRCLTIEVYSVEDQKPIQIAKAVKKNIDDYKQSLPAGIRLSMVRDLSEVFGERAKLLSKNACIGLVLVFFCLALFLEFRLAFWVSMGIPASILGSFLILPFFGFSINMISMFAFIVTLGIVVDDAIVVGENIFHYRQGGMPYLDAAIQGATEIAMPVTFSILTNVVAFIPLFFIPGFLGKIFKMIPAVVIAVLAISLLESLFVLPSHLGHLKRKKRTAKKSIFRLQENFSYAFSRFIEIHYGDFIKKSLKNRYVVLALAIAILICTIAYVKSDRMGMVMFPKSESNYAYVTVSLPYGSPEIKAQSILNRLVEGANRVIEKNGGEKLTRGVLARIDENVVSARIILTPPEQRPIGTQKVTDLWREEVGQLSGVESVSFQSDRGGPGHGKSLTVELSHRDADTLTRASEDLAEELSTFPNAKDIDDGSASGKLQYDFFMLPEGERLGFTASEVALKIRHALYGAEVQRLQRGRDEVKVIVRLPEIERNAEFTLEDMVIQSPSGVETPLSDIVRRESGRAYTSIIRRNGKRISSVEADIMPASETGLVVKELKAGILPKLAQKYPALSYSFEGRQADMKESIASLINGLMMSLIVIFCLLAIPLRSYLQPLLIMACIPFGIVGAFIGHLLLGYSLSVMSLFGVVALSGVVVNDSLVLIDCANKKKLGDMTPFEAIHSAGIQRFRPIMLTTITTFGGLAPMIFETSRQAKFLIPMAISLGFGILFATLITLVLVPVLYMILEDFKASVSR